MTDTNKPKDDGNAEDDSFEDRAYPSASPEVRAWLKENRALIRAFLASDHGRSEARQRPTEAPMGETDVPDHPPGSDT